jgi:CspA family cold shock protein
LVYHSFFRRLLLIRGRVDWYSTKLGHGFIVPEDGGPKAFVQRKDIVVGEEKSLENNDKVFYEVTQGTEGPEARNVSRVYL